MIPWYILRYYAKKHTKFFVSTISLLFLTLLFYRYFQLFLALWSFLLGICLAYSSISSSTLLPNLLFTHTRKKKAVTEDELTMMKTLCTVCGQRKCPRHRPELNILAFQPWTNLKVRGKVNEAIEEFVNIVLKEYLYTWYKDLSKDEEFVDELKSSLRFLASVILRRAKKLDISKMVSEKLIRAGLLHLHLYLKAQRTAPSGADLQAESLKLLGPNLHCAMQSRKSELEYLRRLIESLFPYILKPQGLHSKCTCSLVREMLTNSILLPALDAVANPDMVNNLLLIFLDNTPPPEATEPPAPLVPFLGTFSQPLAKNHSCLRWQLSDVMNTEQTQLLFSFMQFLKSEAAINVLQFCLQCDDFNKKILNPDLSQGDLDELHNMAKDLYRSYCSPSALDRIKFDEDIVEELRKVVEGPSDQVIRLRTSTPLFKAYEHSYDLLENTFLPLYHQCDDYYTMICGSVIEPQTSRSSMNLQPQPRSIWNNLRPKKKESGFSNFGTKIKGVFNKSGDMKSLPEGDNFDDADNISTTATCGSLDDEIPESMAMDGTFHEFHPPDLSTWRVSIPRIGARPDLDNPKKEYFVFIIDIRRVDDVSKDKFGRANWVVARRYNEFYALESKLLEFHGELMQDCQLPAKKSFGTSKHEFIDNKRELFEQYLQKLLTKPYLKGSQLLFNFLTSEDEFTSKFLPDIKLGQMMKSIIVKERGQHLETFLQSFEQSTIAEKPRSGKPERRGSDASVRSSSSEVLCNSLYENNAGYSTDSLASSWSMEGSLKSETSSGEEIYEEADSQDVDGVFDTLIYIARYVYKIPDWFHHLLYTARILLKNTVENYLEWYIDHKIEMVTQEHRLVPIIHLLRDTLFFDTDPPRTDEQKKERYHKTLAAALEFLPKPFIKVVGESNHEHGTKLIVDILQQPKLNKQLSYVFLDIFIQELFPELRG